VDDGPAAYLATSEGANDGWEATLDGRRLQPITLDGFRQGFVVPSGAGGTITMRFAPDAPYRTSLLLGLLPLVALAITAQRRRAPIGPPRPGSVAPLRSTVALPLALVVGGLLAGIGGVVLAALACAATHAAARRAHGALAAGALVLLGGVVVAVQPGRYPGTDEGTFGAPAQLLTAAGLAALVWATAAADPARRRPGPDPDAVPSDDVDDDDP
jgi:arabinofuranan 3-O-arabinosyltransferase